MAEWRKWLFSDEKKRLVWLEKRVKEITDEITRIRRMASTRRDRGEMPKRKRKGNKDE